MGTGLPLVIPQTVFCHQAMFNVGNKHFHLTFHLVLGISVEQEWRIVLALLCLCTGSHAAEWL